MSLAPALSHSKLRTAWERRSCRRTALMYADFFGTVSEINRYAAAGLAGNDVESIFGHVYEKGGGRGLKTRHIYTHLSRQRAISYLGMYIAFLSIGFMRRDCLGTWYRVLRQGMHRHPVLGTASAKRPAPPSPTGRWQPRQGWSRRWPARRPAAAAAAAAAALSAAAVRTR